MDSSLRPTDAVDPVRQIQIDDELWTVRERAAGSLDRRVSLSLVFECRHAIRRVRNYPANWASLTDEELAALSWSR